ncbi:rho guanine nucleotide exchange factor 3 [Lycorma delicatula]|uniref:rho guanine nucleotide exchange factor 3 n=1 Tax=Lycorma delicatula TaxID=130591 RepID=UPI003F512096
MHLSNNCSSPSCETVLRHNSWPNVKAVDNSGGSGVVRLLSYTTFDQIDISSIKKDNISPQHKSQTGWGGSGGGSRSLAASAGGGSAGRPSSNNPSISLHQKQQLQQLAGSLLRPSTPETARTAPATPVHDISSNTLVVDNIRLQPGSSNAGTGVSSNLTTSTKTRFSSTPHLDPAANIRRQQWVVDSRSTIHNNKNNNNDDNDEHYEDEEDYDDDDDDDGGHGGDCDNEDDDHDIEVGHTNQASSSNTTSKSKDNCKQRLQKSYTSNSSVQGGIGSASTSSESVLQKFRKSFSLRFYKKGGGGGVSSSKDDEEHQQPQRASTEPSLPITSSCSCPSKDDNSSDKFRFGPLIWRSSKERRKGKKAARSAKCNSGDSGIQIEISTSRGGGDSSESQHDTDHMCEEEQMCDDVDSPLVVRRRPNNTANCDSSIGDSKPPSRPSSDVINQILIDKLKAGLQAHSFSRHVGRGSHVPVRRTHSDLGGQRLFNWEMRGSYRRMLSTPSPIKIRPNLSPRKSNNTSTTDITSVTNIKASSRRLACRLTGLRRSISQPLGLNELSSIKTIGNIGGRVSHVSHLSEDEKGITSDDEILSDSESSMTSLNERKKSFEQVMDEEVVILAEAVWDHVAMETEELAFRAGDVIEVLDTLDRDWWWGSCNNCVGWFPSAFVRLRVSQEDTVEDCLAAMASGGSKQLRRRTSISLLSNDQVRSRVVRELINTERDFVKVLRDVAEGYLAECRRRTDMFSEEQITTIFGNLEQLLQFQSEFLEDLEKCVEWDAPHKSCIGDTFLKHQAGFRMYSEYCNSHPLAIATLQELYQHNSYNKFFEACRLMRGLIEIPLDGYLLTPVQRICKYPLQLAELLKYTKSDHLDHSKIQEALEAMRGVAVLINERKRRMESLEKLASWQQRVEGWEGDDLIEGSSQLIYQGEAVRITTGMWTSSIMLFLFDHQLVYCKKDILKRNTYVYKGRMEMDTSDVINVADGKDPQLGVSIRHGIKVYSCIRDKWLLFCCRTQQEKSKWLEAFAEERRLVAQDLRDGLEFAPAARQLARIAAAQCYRRPPNKPRGKNYKRGIGSSDAVALSARSNGLNGSTHSLGRRVGTWFTFGGNKKTRALGRAATLQTVHPS